ncbi:MAG: hypothetical protein Q9219_004394 [cf. Caloplaca sp. 3 TL-2023]
MWTRSAYPPEACFLNIIAALHQAALGDFKGTIRTAGYRTTRFRQPLVVVNEPGDTNRIPSAYVVWGFFLTSQHLQITQSFAQSFYSLQWKGIEVGGIGIGTGPARPSATTTGDPATLRNRALSIDFAFYGNQDLGKDAVYMTIISALVNAAPPPANEPVRETWSSFLHDQPVIFVVVPTTAARSSAPYFTYEDLIYTAARSADHCVSNGEYRPLKMSVSIGGVKVADGVITTRSHISPSISNETLQKDVLTSF